MSSSTTSRGSARTAMRRFSAGALIAIVEMPVPLTMAEYAELFGHELEHVIEQIDGVDLQAITDAREGATRLAGGAYETARARRAGRLIAEQIERPRAGGAGTIDDLPASQCGTRADSSSRCVLGHDERADGGGSGCATSHVSTARRDRDSRRARDPTAVISRDVD